MNVKTLAHEIHHGLRATVSPDFKRSHAHELIAAAFGDGSYAALLARGVLCPMPPSLAQRQHLDQTAIAHRAQALGYPQSSTDAISRRVVEAIEESGLRLLPLDLVLQVLLKGQTELYGWDLASQGGEADAIAADSEQEADDGDELDEKGWYARQREEEAALMELADEQVVSALAEAMERSDGRAQLAMALLLAGDLDTLETSSSVGGRYWHEHERNGRQLSGVEKEWAEGYRQEVDAHQTARAHLEAAADLGQPDGLLIMARQHRDPRFFSLRRPRVHADPIEVADVADGLGFPEAALQWLEIAAEQGDMQAMRELITVRQAEDPLKCWTWFHLAKLYGKDLTKDDYRAIHEDGSPYDDDVGGPLFADGFDGVKLPEASEETRQIAELRAKEIFSS